MDEQIRRGEREREYIDEQTRRREVFAGFT